MTSSIDLFWWSPRRRAATRLRFVRQHARAMVGLHRFGGGVLDNFGDELSPLVLEAATGRPVRWASPQRASLYGVGSIVEIAAGHRDAQIWGSGLKHGGVGAPAVDSGRVLAVRGPHTAAALGVADAPQGDPGLLVGLFQRRPPTARGVVVVPHFMSFGAQAAVAQLRRCQVEGWTVVPPTSPVRDVVAAIAGAELAICSSLHGVVTAHALGVPVVLAEFAGPQEPRFKYDDHFAALGLTAAHVPLQAILDDGLGAHRGPADAAAEVLQPRVATAIERLLAAATRVA